MTNEPNLFQSWLAWRDFLKGEKLNLYTLTGMEHPPRVLFIKKKREQLDLPPGDICPVCDGWEQTILDGNTVWCLCRVLEWETGLHEQDELFHRPDKTSLSDLVAYGDPQAKMRLQSFLKKLNEWVKKPDRWLTISGPVGTGKTHALKAIANMFWPLTMYVPATELEGKLFTWMNEGTLEENLLIVTRAPILLYDDMGADYGGKFAEAKIRAVIDWRYSHATNHITVVTTNIPQRVLISNAASGDRVVSRLLDKAIGDLIDLSLVPDYRNKVR